MKLTIDKYFVHNYDNDKVVEWMEKNHIPETDAKNYNGSDNGFGCMCNLYEKYDLNEDTNFNRFIGNFIKTNKGKEVPYMSYYDKYPTEFLIKKIPSLTNEEKKELETAENVRVYYCSHCNEWCLDVDGW